MVNHIFIQARMESKRFPNKILKKIMNKTLFAYIVERAKRVKRIDNVILVTGSQKKNKQLVEEAKKLEIDFFCGNDENLLDRFYQASKKFSSDNIVRVTGDNPLIDYSIISKAFSSFLKNQVDILSVNRKPTLPLGLNFEIFTAQALRKAWEDASKSFMDKNKFYLSFVSPVKYLLYSENFINYDYTIKTNYSHYRLTVDSKEDFLLISKIIEALSPKVNFLLNDIIKYLNSNPSLLKINSRYTKNHP